MIRGLEAPIGPFALSGRRVGAGSRLMSRLRKEVLASRVGNGEDAAALAAPAKQRGPRGLAMKEGRRMKVPMGVRSETRSLEAETHDLERQLDNLRVQMAMEKERQQTLV